MLPLNRGATNGSGGTDSCSLPKQPSDTGFGLPQRRHSYLNHNRHRGRCSNRETGVGNRPGSGAPSPGRLGFIRRNRRLSIRTTLPHTGGHFAAPGISELLDYLLSSVHVGLYPFLYNE